MPNPNAIIDTVQRIDPPPALAQANRAAMVTVHLRGGATAQLDMSRPNATALAGLLDDLRMQGSEVYLDVDPTNQTIARVLLPRPSVVATVAPAPANNRHEVSLIDSHATYYLDVNNPDYNQFLNDLTASARQQAPVLVTYALDRPEIVDVRPAPKQGAGPAPTPAANPAPADSAPPAQSGISPQEAQRAFNIAATPNCPAANPTAPCIPFQYPRDGCWGRAHEMCRLLIAAGFAPRKVWIFGRLRVKTKNDPNCAVEWGWHVAPTLLVNTGSSSQVWVVDPSMFQSAVAQANWVSAQSDPAARVQDTPADVFYKNESGSDTRYDANYSQTNAVLTRYRNELRARTAQYGPPPFNCP